MAVHIHIKTEFEILADSTCQSMTMMKCFSVLLCILCFLNNFVCGEQDGSFEDYEKYYDTNFPMYYENSINESLTVVPDTNSSLNGGSEGYLDRFGASGGVVSAVASAYLLSFVTFIT